MLSIFGGNTGVFCGSVYIKGLPKCKFYSVSISLFEVDDLDSPLPFKRGAGCGKLYKSDVHKRNRRYIQLADQFRN